ERLPRRVRSARPGHLCAGPAPLAPAGRRSTPDVWALTALPAWSAYHHTIHGFRDPSGIAGYDLMFSSDLISGVSVHHDSIQFNPGPAVRARVVLLALLFEDNAETNIRRRCLWVPLGSGANAEQDRHVVSIPFTP